jgi:hypothetical protein
VISLLFTSRTLPCITLHFNIMKTKKKERKKNMWGKHYRPTSTALGIDKEKKSARKLQKAHGLALGGLGKVETTAGTVVLMGSVGTSPLPAVMVGEVGSGV